MIHGSNHGGNNMFCTYLVLCYNIRVFKAGILVISDKGASGDREDISGPTAREMLLTLPADVIDYSIIPDDKDTIAARLIEWADEHNLDIIVTSGGTGLAPRDVTPEATLKVIEKEIPGLAEAMRMVTMKNNPYAILSRAVTGSRGKCLIVNLPGSPGGVTECLGSIMPAIPHALETLAGKVHQGPHYKG
jgi:molybdenum cofactor synthesis domain-containing protein